MKILTGILAWCSLCYLPFGFIILLKILDQKVFDINCFIIALVVWVAAILSLRRYIRK